MKKLVFLAAALFNFSLFFAQEIRVGVLNGPSCIPAAYMMENNKNINGADVYFEKFADPQTLLPKLLKKEIDVGFLPVNVAAKVYNSSNKSIICCGITGNGNLSLITKDKKIKSLSDLKGKTVNIAGQGATPEYIFRQLLEENKLEADTDTGVKLDFSIPTAQIPSQLISGKISYAVVPEPFATIAQLKSKDVIAAVDLQKDEYEVFYSDTFPLTVMVVRKEFAEENEELLDSFLYRYKKSFEYTVKNPKAAGRLCEKYDLGLEAGVVAAAIPKSNYVYIPAKDGKNKIEALLNIFMKNQSESIGKKLPGDDFYYKYQ